MILCHDMLLFFPLQSVDIQIYTKFVDIYYFKCRMEMEMFGHFSGTYRYELQNMGYAL